MEFLAEQRVQPCGHKARAKGILIKMLASCKSNEIPTKYRYLVNGAINEPSGEMSFLISKQLLETQTTVSVDSSHLRCCIKDIDGPCLLKFTESRGDESAINASPNIHISMQPIQQRN